MIVKTDDPRVLRSLLAQARAPWGDDNIGDSTKSIARYGCALTALCSAARFLGSDLDIAPGRANTIATTARAYSGASLLTDRLAPCLGLVAGERVTMDAGASFDDVFAELERVLATGGVGMVHVDTDAGRPGTSPDGNHYITAVGYEDERRERVVCLDPAGGRVVLLSLPDLSCDAPPGRPRPYATRGVRGLWRVAEG